MFVVGSLVRLLLSVRMELISRVRLGILVLGRVIQDRQGCMRALSAMKTMMLHWASPDASRLSTACPCCARFLLHSNYRECCTIPRRSRLLRTRRSDPCS
eukprot:5927489-Pyramimonas_sp.AAC.1